MPATPILLIQAARAALLGVACIVVIVLIHPAVGFTWLLGGVAVVMFAAAATALVVVLRRRRAR